MKDSEKVPKTKGFGLVEMLNEVRTENKTEQGKRVKKA